MRKFMALLATAAITVAAVPAFAAAETTDLEEPAAAEVEVTTEEAVTEEAEAVTEEVEEAAAAKDAVTEDAAEEPKAVETDETVEATDDSEAVEEDATAAEAVTEETDETVETIAEEAVAEEVKSEDENAVTVEAVETEENVEATPQVAIQPISENVRVGYIVNSEEENVTHTYTYYVISHSEQGKSYWASSMDGSKNLWFYEHENKGERLNVNDNFKASFDKNGRLLSIEKITY